MLAAVVQLDPNIAGYEVRTDGGDSKPVVIISYEITGLNDLFDR